MNQVGTGALRGLARRCFGGMGAEMGGRLRVCLGGVFICSPQLFPSAETFR
jgi:hypothetical protein